MEQSLLLFSARTAIDNGPVANFGVLDIFGVSGKSARNHAGQQLRCKDSIGPAKKSSVKVIKNVPPSPEQAVVLYRARQCSRMPCGKAAPIMMD